jgi:ADP-ribose pyrophosphatase YjhB (NUDIX family)
MQMYKVFVNDCLIILTDNKNISTNLNKVFFEDTAIIELVEKLFQEKHEGICLLCNDLNESWNKFQSYFKVQKAAGGRVLNSAKKILFIYRFDKWDLPKGKLEKGENIEHCAIREVKEECGITNLQIEKQLQTTYHIFMRKGKTILKVTYWFLMTTTYLGKLTPQIDEGIVHVVFKNDIETKEALKNSYENIKLLF